MRSSWLASATKRRSRSRPASRRSSISLSVSPRRATSSCAAAAEGARRRRRRDLAGSAPHRLHGPQRRGGDAIAEPATRAAARAGRAIRSCVSKRVERLVAVLERRADQDARDRSRRATGAATSRAGASRRRRPRRSARRRSARLRALAARRRVSSWDRAGVADGARSIDPCRIDHLRETVLVSDESRDPRRRAGAARRSARPTRRCGPAGRSFDSLVERRRRAAGRETPRAPRARPPSRRAKRA